MSNHDTRQTRSKKWMTRAGIPLGVSLVGVDAFPIWNSVAEKRLASRAEEAVHTALTQWRSSEPLDRLPGHRYSPGQGSHAFR